MQVNLGGFWNESRKNSLDSSIRVDINFSSHYICRWLPKIDLRIEIFLFKLVFTENFMFGHFVFTITLACEAIPLHLHVCGISAWSEKRAP
jgi:hypothetical protein